VEEGSQAAASAGAGAALSKIQQPPCCSELLDSPNLVSTPAGLHSSNPLRAEKVKGSVWLYH
jgi:hypothetical protein